MFADMVDEKRGMLIKLLEQLEDPEVALQKVTQVSEIRHVSAVQPTLGYMTSGLSSCGVAFLAPSRLYPY